MLIIPRAVVVVEAVPIFNVYVPPPVAIRLHVPAFFRDILTVVPVADKVDALVFAEPIFIALAPLSFQY